MTATFHNDGTLSSMTTLLNRSKRAGPREEDHLKIRSGPREREWKMVLTSSSPAPTPLQKLD